jgi:hypothetical protein
MPDPVLRLEKLELRRNIGGLGDWWYSEARVKSGDVDLTVNLSPPAQREIAALVIKDARERMEVALSYDK